MSNVTVYESLKDASGIIMKARLSTQNGGPVLDKLRRVSRYIESQIGTILYEVTSETLASPTDSGVNLVPAEDACQKCGERDADKLELPDENEVHPAKIVMYRKCLTCGYQKK